MKLIFMKKKDKQKTKNKFFKSEILITILIMKVNGL